VGVDTEVRACGARMIADDAITVATLSALVDDFYPAA
jgi:hypothetical protein